MLNYHFFLIFYILFLILFLHNLILFTEPSDDHKKINPKEFICDQPTEINLQERFETYKETPLMFLSYIKSFDQFVSHLPNAILRKELIEHYEKEVLPKLEGNAKEKMDEFINDCRNDGWGKVNHSDCLLSDEELDMSEYEMVEKPKGQMHNASVIAKTKDGKTLFDLTGRFSC